MIDFKPTQIRQSISAIGICLLHLAGGNPLFADSGQGATVDFSVCYDFSCKTESTVQISQGEWNSIKSIFLPPAKTAEVERKQMQSAVGRMEVIVGTYTPTHRDIARNLGSTSNTIEDTTGQLDCVDESLNSTTYLSLFEQHNLLQFHRVTDRAHRRALLNQHWAGQVVELDTGQKFIFDSWFRDNGEPPYVVPGQIWHDLSLFGRNRHKQKSRDLRLAFQAQK